MLKNFKVKLATLEDVDRLVDLSLVWAKEMGYDPIAAELREDLERLVTTGVILYVLTEGQIAGYMSGLSLYHFWKKQRIAHEHFFFVSPAFRRQGVCDILLESFAFWAKHEGCSGIIITPNRFGSNKPEILADFLIRKGYIQHGIQMWKDC